MDNLLYLFDCFGLDYVVRHTGRHQAEISGIATKDFRIVKKILRPDYLREFRFYSHVCNFL